MASSLSATESLDGEALPFVSDDGITWGYLPNSERITMHERVPLLGYPDESEQSMK